MLSPEEKKEMLADAKSLNRRKDFAKAKNLTSKKRPSLDEYISFLISIQKIFPSSLPLAKQTITKLNKL